MPLIACFIKERFFVKTFSVVAPYIIGWLFSEDCIFVDKKGIANFIDDVQL